MTFEQKPEQLRNCRSRVDPPLHVHEDVPAELRKSLPILPDIIS
jgi:hypothetical protein